MRSRPGQQSAAAPRASQGKARGGPRAGGDPRKPFAPAAPSESRTARWWPRRRGERVLTKTFKKKRFASSPGVPGQPDFGKGAGGRAAARSILRAPPRGPRRPRSPPGRAHFCPRVHSRWQVPRSWMQQAAEAPGTAEMREGFYCGFLRVLSYCRGEGGASLVPSQYEWVTYLPAWPAQSSVARTRPAPGRPARAGWARAARRDL